MRFEYCARSELRGTSPIHFARLGPCKQRRRVWVGRPAAALLLDRASAVCIFGPYPAISLGVDGLIGVRSIGFGQLGRMEGRTYEPQPRWARTLRHEAKRASQRDWNKHEHGNTPKAVRNNPRCIAVL